jgi:hypothetical protein
MSATQPDTIDATRRADRARISRVLLRATAYGKAPWFDAVRAAHAAAAGDPDLEAFVAELAAQGARLP